ncbi:hypothetical protein OB920_17390 [Halobacteria archaeon HArc-gm2]|nr:hypothetical protein [Halobacteria archaeon HArc-gm2]
MSNRAVRTDGWLDGRIDQIGAVAGLLLAAALFPLRFLTENLFIQVVPVLIGIGSGLYLVTAHFGREDVAAVRWRLSDLAGRSLGGVTLLAVGSLGLVATTTGGRSLPFFGLASAVGALIFVQVLFVRDSALRPGSIVLQVVAFALVVRFAALATTPGLIGVDSWTHVTEYAQAIREGGSLAAIADVKYVAAPLYHLLAVVAAEAFNTSIRLAVYATLGLVMPLSVVLVYLTTRHFLPVRWSLFAMATYAVADHVVRWGVHLIPTSMGLVFFLVVVYGITKLFFVDREGPVFGLTILVGVAVVLTHQISAFVTLCFLAAAVAAQWVVWLADRHGSLGRVTAGRETTNVTPVFALVCGLTVVNWAFTPYGSGTFIETMVGSLRRALDGSVGFLQLMGSEPAAGGALAAVVTDVPKWVEFVDALGFFLLLTAVVLGSLTLVRSDRFSQLSLTYVIAAAGMLVVVLGLPLFGLNLFLPGRWYAFMYAPMAIIAAIGVRYLSTRLSSRAVVAGLLVLALVFPGAMLASNKAAPGDPMFDEHYPRYSGTSAELAAVETVSAIHPDGAPALQTDHPYRTLFTRWQGEEVEGLALGEDGTVSADAAVYREYQTHGAASARYQDDWVQVQLQESTVCGGETAVLYANEEVRYCQSPAAL